MIGIIVRSGRSRLLGRRCVPLLSVRHRGVVSPGRIARNGPYALFHTSLYGSAETTKEETQGTREPIEKKEAETGAEQGGNNGSEGPKETGENVNKKAEEKATEDTKDTKEEKQSKENHTETAKAQAEQPSEQPDSKVEGEKQPGESDPLKECEKNLEISRAETLAMKDAYLRCLANFTGLQKTSEREIKKAKDFAIQKFAKDLLESADNFERALASVPPDVLNLNKQLQDVYEGIEMTKNVFLKTLAKHGIEKIDPLGEPFDPNKHEATFEVPQPDIEPGTVFFVQQVGYTLNGRVIRPAKVGVVKGED